MRLRAKVRCTPWGADRPALLLAGLQLCLQGGSAGKDVTHWHKRTHVLIKTANSNSELASCTKLFKEMQQAQTCAATSSALLYTFSCQLKVRVTLKGSGRPDVLACCTGSPAPASALLLLAAYSIIYGLV